MLHIAVMMFVGTMCMLSPVMVLVALFMLFGRTGG